MKKQVMYPSLMKRLFASLMDLLLLSFILTPITSILNKRVIVEKFGDLFKAKNVDIDDYKAVAEALQSPDFAPYSNWTTMIDLMKPMLVMQLIAMTIYFILSWKLWGCTPAKYVMRMRVVDQKTFEKPTIYQLLLRFISYTLCIFGIWFIFFTKQKQALHDKIAGTVVISA